MKRSPAARRKPGHARARRPAGAGKPRSGKRVARQTTARDGRIALVDAAAAEVEQVEALRARLEDMSRRSGPPRWNANPEEVRCGVMKLVLTLVELIRQLLERQAIRRMEANTLTPEETENVGLALMRLESTIRELAEQFDLRPEDLNLDLGPIGKLL